MIKEIESPALKELLDKNQQLKLIDCREQEEWDTGYIDQAHFMPLSQFQQKIQEAMDSGLLKKDEKIVIQCRSGKRSFEACKYLQTLGFEDLTNLSDGILGWAQQGFPIKEDV